MHSYVVFYINYLVFPIIIIIIVLSLLSICKLFNDKVIINMMIREKYSKVIKYILKEGYSFILIIPFVLLVSFLVEGCITGFGSGLWDNFIVDNYILFIICYIVNIILWLSFYINVAIICFRRKFNYVIASISALLIIIGMEIISEVVNSLYAYVLFNTLSIFGYSPVQYGLFYPLNISLFWCLLSWIILYFSYRNKEKLVLDIEKQNEEE